MGKIPLSNLERIKHLYYHLGLGAPPIAKKLKVSTDAVYYFMRHNKLTRRTFSEENALRFKRKIPSFKIKINLSNSQKELRAIGAMLYWGEGYKSEKATSVDFANSDPEMVLMFLRFLRGIYKLDPKKFRVLLYCYANQNMESLIGFWSRLTGIPRKQFTKPYIRSDFKVNGRKMEHGLVHIRYIDKKLLLDLKSLIQFYKKKYAQVVP